MFDRARWFLLFASLLFSSAAVAHFKLNLNIRVIHVDHQSDGLYVYMRLPMPYLVADRVGDLQSDGSRTPAPYTVNGLVDGEWMHYLDYSAWEAGPAGLGELAVSGHEFVAKGTKLIPELKNTRVYRGISQPPFSTLKEAIAAFESDEEPPVSPAPFVGDVVVDVLIHYPSSRAIKSYAISSSLDPGLEGQQDTANLILDYADPEPAIFRETGLLQQPVVVSNSVWKAAATFVEEGVRHILAGYDHVLFVVCLVLGATLFSSLVWRVTGFTIGHSLTLSLGFFGYVSDAPWFIPLIEMSIALSIIIAAVLALSTQQSQGKQLSGFVIATLIGMLHGLGFSFVLQEILGVTSPNIWMSLLSFNIGVELGQLAIVCLMWPLLYLVARNFPAQLTTLKWLIAMPCIAVAAYWTGERSTGLLEVL